jgi:hypothetical protein
VQWKGSVVLPLSAKLGELKGQAGMITAAPSLHTNAASLLC